jgi:hypothetical protein
MSLDTPYYTPSKNFFPPSLVPIQVRCEQCFGFRCLAYQDAEDIWRDFKTGAPLIGKVEPVEYLFETPEEDKSS